MTGAVPLLFIQGAGVADADVRELRASPRVHLVHRDGQHAQALAFTSRAVRATLVATARDPIEELVFTRTAGLTGPLAFAVTPEYAPVCGALREAGLLDCLVQPITPEALDRFLDAVERLPLPPISYPPLDLLLDWPSSTARRGRKEVHLSQRQFALLHLLVQNGSRPVPVKEMLEHVWGSQEATAGTREIVDVNVSQLRKRLARIGLKDAIKTYRAFGYGLRD